MKEEITQNDIQSALGRLIGWMESWRTPGGAYHGFVVHRYETKRMYRIHDTPWTQAAMIRGYANLFEISRENRWLEAMTRAADLQCRRFLPESGKYLYAGHENDRFCSLVHCALADSALLRAVPFVDAGRQARYVNAVKQNVDRYILDKLWVPKEGAFRFSEIDFYSRHENRYVINFNTMAAEVLLGLASVTGQQAYRDRAIQVGQWLLDRWEEAKLHEAGTPADNKQDQRKQAPAGGLPYQYTPSNRTPDNCVTVYTGLALRGIRKLYDATGNDKFVQIARGAGAYLLAMRDPQTHLFYHTTNNGKIVRYPQFIAGAGMTLVGLHEIRPFFAQDDSVKKTVRAILDRTYSNGAVPGFIGKDASRLKGKNRLVWEDVAASPNWNAQWFEYLSAQVETPVDITIRHPSPVTVRAQNLVYRDSPSSVSIFCLWPPASVCVYMARKKSMHAGISFRLQGLRGRIIRFPRAILRKCKLS